MKFVIDSVTKCSGRLGKITLERIPDLELKTPLLILNTKVRNNGKKNFIIFNRKKLICRVPVFLTFPVKY